MSVFDIVIISKIDRNGLNLPDIVFVSPIMFTNSTEIDCTEEDLNFHQSLPMSQTIQAPFNLPQQGKAIFIYIIVTKLKIQIK